MSRLLAITALLCITTCAIAVTPSAVAQAPSPNQPSDSALPATLRICLRLDDQSPFLGAARVLVLPESGYELLGVRDDKGEVVFYSVPPGTYTLDVTAPPFLPVRLRLQMEPAHEKSVFVALKRHSSPKPEPPQQAQPEQRQELLAPVDAFQPVTETLLETKLQPVSPFSANTAIETVKPEKEPWRPVEWSDEGTALDQTVACPADQVLHVAGEHVREFVTSMEKFTATETVEHFSVGKNGDRKQPETRKFAYVVTITQDRHGTFALEEFRNGDADHSQFPANIATMGLPAVALVFHPDYSGDFRFNCDGLVRAHDREYWQVRFAQREDRPVRIESYVVNGSAYPVYLQGRAWIDPGKGQIVRLESQLLKPTPQIELWQQHQVIDYTGVKFVSTGQEVWLPQAAEVYVERHNRRYFRRHSFQDFRLFNVETAQSTKPPKGSYSFTNLTDNDMTGELTVNPIEELKGGPIILRFELPAHRTVVKTVGPGKDVNLPPAHVASAQFVHSGGSGSVKVDVDLVKETTLDVIPESALANP
jgi:hypothetical protein